MNKKIRTLTYGALTAALYVVLTELSAAMGLASGAIQLRLSEMLTILPVFTVGAVPGLFIGCLIANLITGCLPWDIVLGSLATLAGAYFTYRFRSKPYLAPVFPIAANALIVPPVLMYVYGIPGGYWYFLLTVTIGEVLSCGVLGMILYRAVKRTGFFAKNS